MKRIILASGSPRRKEILNSAGLRFDVVPSEYEEDNSHQLPPAQLVEYLSLGKAKWVAERHPDALVIAADTLVSLDNVILGKPKKADELRTMISSLSGRSHSTYTGFTIIDGEHTVTESVKTKVFFRDITSKELDSYVLSRDGLDKAGGYGIQSLAAVFIERIEGDYFNVVGLPICRLAVRLKEFGVEVLN